MEEEEKEVKETPEYGLCMICEIPLISEDNGASTRCPQCGRKLLLDTLGRPDGVASLPDEVFTGEYKGIFVDPEENIICDVQEGIELKPKKSS